MFWRESIESGRSCVGCVVVELSMIVLTRILQKSLTKIETEGVLFHGKLLKKMEQKRSVPWRPKCPQILLWCCFCNERFKEPSELDRHLDRYKVNWKLYWQLYYSGQKGLSCHLCDILHADRKSLQCHFKMVHCISGQLCAVRGHVSLEPARHEGDQKVYSHTLKPFAGPAEMLRGPLKTTHAHTDPRKNRGVPDSTNMDEVDVLFEINRTDSPSAELSNDVRSSASNVLPGATVPCAEPLSGSDDDVQVLEEVEGSCSSSQGSGCASNDEPAVILADGSDLSRLIAPSSAITVLGSDDEVEELESHEVAMASPSGEIMEGYEGGVVGAQVEDSHGHDASATHASTTRPTARSCRRDMHTNIFSITPSVRPPTEGGHDRPTAIVNPFGSQEEGCLRSTPNDARTQIETALRSDMVQLPSYATAADDSCMSLPETRRREFHVEANVSSVVSSQDPLDGCGDCPADALVNVKPSSEDCGPDGLVPEEGVSGEQIVRRRLKEPSVRFRQPLPDLSRLTPSKIAAFMNRDVLPMSCQPDFESHFEGKPLHNVLHGTIDVDSHDRLHSRGDSYDSDVDIELGNTTEGHHVESEGRSRSHSPESHGDPIERLPGERKWVLSPRGSSTEDEDSLPCGLSIVSVETLLAKKLENDEPEPEPLATRLGSDTRKRAHSSSGMPRRCRSSTRLAKGTEEDPNLPGRDSYAVRQRAARPEEEHDAELSPAKKRQVSSQLDYPSTRTGDQEVGSLGVFKQPIWCVLR
ncbi:uncharacterized protein LOC119108864 [Pollicipes pollicipes]|uniref:uncharacterized protein LOC119108864 n=1 Tax=Pollicipes pollicipes TaxID=41117 RepID=UPI001885219B|nr:uncharacterized protein LOC119108864 [Pollicipes pollicipes]